jgi:zinc transport system substrate-binding protein
MFFQKLKCCLFLIALLSAPVFSNSEAAPAKIKVAVSILPQAYFVERIGAEKVDVRVIMPRYADHDTYQPTPKQMAALAGSDVFIKIGVSHFLFEQKFAKPIFGKNCRTVNMSDGVTLLPDDPHIWLSPHTVRISALNIYKALADRDPSNSEYYKKNLDNFLKDIDTLDMKIKQLLANKRGASFMIFHPALGYFADHYGLKQLVIEKEGKSPSALTLKKLADEARKKHIKTILIQKGFDHKSASALAEEIGAKLLEIDPMGKDWLDNTWEIAEKVNCALGNR